LIVIQLHCGVVLHIHMCLKSPTIYFYFQLLTSSSVHDSLQITFCNTGHYRLSRNSVTSVTSSLWVQCNRIHYNMHSLSLSLSLSFSPSFSLNQSCWVSICRLHFHKRFVHFLYISLLSFISLYCWIVWNNAMNTNHRLSRFMVGLFMYVRGSMWEGASLSLECSFLAIIIHHHEWRYFRLQIDSKLILFVLISNYLLACVSFYISFISAHILITQWHNIKFSVLNTGCFSDCFIDGAMLQIELLPLHNYYLYTIIPFEVCVLFQLLWFVVDIPAVHKV
jgi:hypothetical protein